MAWDGKFFVVGASGTPADRNILGNKGLGLHKMARAGLPVPRAIVIPVEACLDFAADPKRVVGIVCKMIPEIKQALCKDGYDPLVSVRSAAPVSMPGMMDTILNVGLDVTTFDAWSSRLSSEVAHDCVRRLVRMYSEVVKGVKLDALEGCDFLECGSIYAAANKEGFPFADVQLCEAVLAVMQSWNTPRAIEYRRLNNIPDTMGTAVIVQEMVFGNLPERSCTGVLFTRNPYTGENEIVGDFLAGHQGEDVVDGSHTGLPLSKMKDSVGRAVAKRLWRLAEKIEALENTPQEVEFTIQRGEVFVLQMRDAKPTPAAAVRIAVDMFAEGRWTAKDVFQRVSFKQYLNASQSVVSPDAPAADAKGVAASLGVVTGVVVDTCADALKCNGPCILVRPETTPDDLVGMNASVGVLTKRGGFTCHAAVVARSLNKVCVVGCDAIEFTSKGPVLNGVPLVGESVTLNGLTGEVWVNKNVPVISGDDSCLLALGRIAREAVGGFEVCSDPDRCKSLARAVFPVFAYARRHSGADIAAVVKKLVESFEGDELILDLFPLHGFTEEDIDVLTSFGSDPLLEGYAKAALSACAEVDLSGKSTAVYICGVGALPPAVGAAGYWHIPVVSDLDTLLSARGYVVVDHALLRERVGESSVKRIVELKTLANEELRSINFARRVSPEPGPIYACGSLDLLKSVLS